MRRARFVLIAVVVTLAVATAGGALVRLAKSDEGSTAFYFSVATKATTGTYANDFIAIFGSGIFGGQDVAGNGIFSISTGLPPSSTNSLASGTWEATRFVSFVSYGVANPRAEGGQLVISITLAFDNGHTVSGVTLTITCRVGLTTPPPPEEGATLSGPVVFDHPAAGITTFGTPPED
jgi:hypothetical protein